MNRACPQYKNRMVKRHPTADEIRFCTLVGGLSEALDDCSYNDGDILTYLLTGTLNKSACNHDDPKKFQLHTGEANSYDYEAELFRLMELTGGWPDSWMEPVTPLHQLPAYYTEIFKQCGKEQLLIQKGETN